MTDTKKEIADEVQNGAIDKQKLVLLPDGDDPFTFTAYPDYLVTERFRTFGTCITLDRYHGRVS